MKCSKSEGLCTPKFFPNLLFNKRLLIIRFEMHPLKWCAYSISRTCFSCHIFNSNCSEAHAFCFMINLLQLLQYVCVQSVINWQAAVLMQLKQPFQQRSCFSTYFNWCASDFLLVGYWFLFARLFVDGIQSWWCHFDLTLTRGCCVYGGCGGSGGCVAQWQEDGASYSITDLLHCSQHHSCYAGYKPFTTCPAGLKFH